MVSQSVALCCSRAVMRSSVDLSRSVGVPYQLLRLTPYSVIGWPTLLPGRVDPELAEERRLALMELQEEIRQAKQEARIGEEIEVLVEGVSDESEFLLDGRHEGQAPGIDGKVILTDGSAEPGSFVRARVTQAEAVDLVASLEL